MFCNCCLWGFIRGEACQLLKLDSMADSVCAMVWRDLYFHRGTICLSCTRILSQCTLTVVGFQHWDSLLGYLSLWFLSQIDSVLAWIPASLGQQSAVRFSALHEKIPGLGSFLCLHLCFQIPCWALPNWYGLHLVVSLNNGRLSIADSYEKHVYMIRETPAWKLHHPSWYHVWCSL